MIFPEYDIKMSFRKFMSGLAVSLLSLVSAIDAIGSHDLQHFITVCTLEATKLTAFGLI